MVRLEKATDICSGIMIAPPGSAKVVDRIRDYGESVDTVRLVARTRQVSYLPVLPL
jgi:hypothetical protein